MSFSSSRSFKKLGVASGDFLKRGNSPRLTAGEKTVPASLFSLLLNEVKKPLMLRKAEPAISGNRRAGRKRQNTPANTPAILTQYSWFPDKDFLFASCWKTTNLTIDVSENPDLSKASRSSKAQKTKMWK